MTLRALIARGCREASDTIVRVTVARIVTGEASLDRGLRALRVASICRDLAALLDPQADAAVNLDVNRGRVEPAASAGARVGSVEQAAGAAQADAKGGQAGEGSTRVVAGDDAWFLDGSGPLMRVLDVQRRDGVDYAVCEWWTLDGRHERWIVRTALRRVTDPRSEPTRSLHVVKGGRA